MDYQYPIDYDWSTDEIVKVISFFQGIERAYENGIEREQLMNLYNEFKRIVPSKSEEKKLCNEFEEVSGYSSYQVIKRAKNNANEGFIKLSR
jgi:uncharacterized protein YktA (UPF0223 family)